MSELRDAINKWKKCINDFPEKVLRNQQLNDSICPKIKSWNSDVSNPKVINTVLDGLDSECNCICIRINKGDGLYERYSEDYVGVRINSAKEGCFFVEVRDLPNDVEKLILQTKHTDFFSDIIYETTVNVCRRIFIHHDDDDDKVSSDENIPKAGELHPEETHYDDEL